MSKIRVSDLVRNAVVKGAVYGSLRMSGAVNLTRRVHRGKALILTYHGVVQKSANDFLDRVCSDADVFEKQMLWLKKNYTIMPLSQVVNGLQGKAPLPPYALAVTFDDGFRNNYSQAYPILKRHGIPATVFLTTSHIGVKGKYLWTDHVDSLIFGSRTPRMDVELNGILTRYDLSSQRGRETASDDIRAYLKTLSPRNRAAKIAFLETQSGFGGDHGGGAERYDFLTWDEVRTMAADGIEFGSHTHSHPILSTLSQEELEAELVESKTAIEKELGRPCDLFSYPNGTPMDFTLRDRSALRDLGFRAAVSQIGGYNHPGEDLYQLKRINISRSRNLSYFQAIVTGIVGLIRK